jgi:purine-binding chemotaxis protein CheW
MNIPQPAEPIATQPPPCRQMLTFVVGHETYGVDILRVQEIRGWSAVTRIPHSPHDVLGVLDLRGAVVPIVDLRLRFGLPNAMYDVTTVIIVLTLDRGRGKGEVGLVVDAVSDVADIDAAQVRPPPHLGASSATEYVKCLLTLKERMVVLLDVDRLLASLEFSNGRTS